MSDLPLPLDRALDRMKLSGATQTSAEAIRGVSVQDRVLQDFRPLTRCLEWELSELYWNSDGVLAFVGNAVPFLINNSGKLSEDAAAVLFANCVEHEPEGEIAVLELGGGIGLFARYFLDAFQAICAQQEKDFYGRLRYFASDRSRRSVEQWAERDLFAPHRDRVTMGTCDATRPAAFQPLGAAAPPPRNLRAVFCNYVLDVLPSAVVRHGERGAEQLCLRTHLIEDPHVVSLYTRLGLHELKQLAASEDAAERARLLPLISLFEFETAFRPLAGEELPHLEEALELGTAADRVVLNHGALDCLDRCTELLAPEGFVLANDYGPTDREEVAAHSTSQRFGTSSAVGLNFPLIEHHFSKRGQCIVTPDEDATAPIHARLISRRRLSGTSAAFDNRFGGAARDHFQKPIDEARAHLAAGRKEDALDAFRAALERSPRDWCVVGEAAEFVGLHLGDAASGLRLAQAAVELNPWYSTWLWNVLGDCLFVLERFEDAHEAYLQAQRIDPGDARTHLNLAYTHHHFGDYPRALEAIATGLASDRHALYRVRLLEKQQQVLSAASARLLGEQERLSRRSLRQLSSS